MRLVPNSWGSVLRERNDCHEPAGRPTGGRFCSQAAALAPVDASLPASHDDWTLEDFRKRREAERAWSKTITHAVSVGDLTVAQAEALGWRDPAGGNAVAGYEPLPPVLYHVSTAVEGILRQGVRSRDELPEGVAGLGGGTSDTISFTDDIKVARAIRSAILEGRRVARGELTPQMMVAQAKAMPGKTRDGRTAYEQLVSFYAGKPWTTGDPMPESLDRLLRGQEIVAASEVVPKGQSSIAGAVAVSKLPPGVTPVETWQGRDEAFTAYVVRELSRERRIEHAFEMFKRFATSREAVGGRMDPLFFLANPAHLAKLKPSDIRILKFKPRSPKARGYRVSSLGEWRVHTGDAVKFDGIAESGGV